MINIDQERYIKKDSFQDAFDSKTMDRLALDPRRPGKEITTPGLWGLSLKSACQVNKNAADKCLSRVVPGIILHNMYRYMQQSHLWIVQMVIFNIFSIDNKH